MNRLCDEPSLDPVHARGTALLRSAAPEPPSPHLQQRVWASIQRREPRTDRRWRPRAVVMTALIIFSSATAGATVGRGWVGRVYHSLTEGGPIEAPTPAMDKRPHRRALSSRATRMSGGSASVPADASHAAAAQVPSRPSSAAARRATSAPGPTQPPSQVLDAMIALRRDGDPVRAGALLDRYLVQHPNGALREEALALAVEAADSRRDPAARERWARVYLRSYPQGRFAEFVRSSIR